MFDKVPKMPPEFIILPGWYILLFGSTIKCTELAHTETVNLNKSQWFHTIWF